MPRKSSRLNRVAGSIVLYVKCLVLLFSLAIYLEVEGSAKLAFYLYYKAKVCLKLRYKYTALIRDYPVQEAKELDYFIDK
jgi:hypothetical protein